MSINLNFTHKNEYKLHNDVIAEAISMYGTECKLILTQKQNVDESVFGDWSNIATNGTNIFDVHVLSVDQDDIERTEYQFTDYGLNYLYNNAVYISTKELARYRLSMESLYNSLLVFPSNQVMEVVNVEFKVPGINNLWAFSDTKSVLKLSLNTYQFKLHDQIEGADLVNTIEVEGNTPGEIAENIAEAKENYDILDNYFESLLKTKDTQEYEAEVKDATIEVDQNSGIVDTDLNNPKPVVDNNETDPFGW